MGVITGINIFDFAANEWDITGLTRDPYFLKFVDLLEIQGYEDITAFGCGSGRQLRKLAEKTTGRVRGIDESSKMVEIAKKATYDLPNVTVYQGDATSAVLKEHSADIVLSYMVFQWVHPRKEFLGQNIRVVRPGGKVACATVTDEEKPTFWNYMEYLQGLINEFPYYYGPDTPQGLMRFPRFSPRDLEKEFQEAGLTNVRTFGIFEENTNNSRYYMKRADLITNGSCFKPLTSNPELKEYVIETLRPQKLTELRDRDGKLVMERTVMAVANA